MTEIGKLRRSGLIGTFGPGSIVDFREGDVAVSGLVAGLEEWDRRFAPAGVANPQSTTEPRLIRKLQAIGLNVTGFRLPPVLTELELDTDSRRLVAVEFPKWMQCPECSKINNDWPKRIDTQARYCPECSEGDDVFVIPVRFVMACERGHLDEFPWHWWVNHKAGCNHRKHLMLETIGAGLAGLILSCPYCDAERSMDGIFSEQTWEKMKSDCTGRKPWIASANDSGCDKVLRAVQRGATNLYFPVTDSSLDIPPWSDMLQLHLGVYWHSIFKLKTAEDRLKRIQAFEDELQPAMNALGWSLDRLASEVETRVKLLDQAEKEDLRNEEYRQFAYGSDTPKEQAHQFEIREERMPETLSKVLRRIVRAVRLREVRVLTGFTRIQPPAGNDRELIAPIAAANPGWLPALEVFGEGIFLDLQPDIVSDWENSESVIQRSEISAQRWKENFKLRYGKEAHWVPSARFLLVHSFAHALMRQLTLDCGYASASLRERLYVGQPEDKMCGVLIYTAATDADGTLGGLQRQGLSRRIEGTVSAAIKALKWCSSDPLCISGHMASHESASGAACHACVLAPETSCEHFNCMLDRAFLVGTPEDRTIGYFSSLL